MTPQHATLAAYRWRQMPFLEQMANIGSEVTRALNWREKNNAEYAKKAFTRALELIDFTLDSAPGVARLKELARLREALVDDFFGSNQFKSTDTLWRRYFFAFAYVVRRRHGLGD